MGEHNVENLVAKATIPGRATRGGYAVSILTGADAVMVTPIYDTAKKFIAYVEIVDMTGRDSSRIAVRVSGLPPFYFERGKRYALFSPFNDPHPRGKYCFRSGDYWVVPLHAYTDAVVARFR